MTISTESQQKIDAYLKVLRKRLRGLNDEDSRDVVEEIRSHILDKAGVGREITPDSVTFTLAALGSPEELARQYVTDRFLTRAQVARSPWLILQSLFRWASLSFAGFCVLTSSLIGYFLAGSFALCALLKPFHPHSAGLWLLPDPADAYSFSLRLGFSTPPTGGREILGWWIVPLGLVIGVGLALLTFYFGLWSIRKLWHPLRSSRLEERRDE
jgi:Protein of unknown function (DUF1700)